MPLSLSKNTTVDYAIAGHIHPAKKVEGAPVSIIPNKTDSPADTKLIPARGITEASEMDKFLNALDRVKAKCEKAQSKPEQEQTPTDLVFQTLGLLLVEDEFIKNPIINKIQEHRYPAEAALKQAINEACKLLGQRNQGNLKDLEKELLKCLKNTKSVYEILLENKDKKDGIVIVSDLFTIFDTAEIEEFHKKYPGVIKGMLQLSGDETCHGHLKAQELGIPFEVVHPKATEIESILNAKKVIYGGTSTEVVLNPSEKKLDEFHKTKEIKRPRLNPKEYPAITKDGHKVVISSAITGSGQQVSSIENGAAGVGLFRTEFLCNGDIAPDKNTLKRLFQNLLLQDKKGFVTIRMPDFGMNDKKLPEYLGASPEQAGLRGTQVLLADGISDKLLLPVLAAALEINDPRLRISFPMVDTTKEADGIIDYINKLKAENKFAKDHTTLFMAETPVAVQNIDLLLKRCDGIAIGTNDLRRSMAVKDHTNPHGESLDMYDRAFILTLKLASEKLEGYNKKNKTEKIAQACGACTNHPEFTPLLIAMGFEICCSPDKIGEINYVVNSVNLKDCKLLLSEILALEDPDEIKLRLERFYADLKPN